LDRDLGGLDWCGPISAYSRKWIRFGNPEMMIDELKALTFFPAGRHIVILSRPICEDFQGPNIQLPAESSAMQLGGRLNCRHERRIIQCWRYATIPPHNIALDGAAK